MTAQTEDLIARIETEVRAWETTRDDGSSGLTFEGLLTEAAQALRALQQEVERLREACVAIQNLEHTEDNEWDAVETVIPAMVAVATKALTRASTKDDCAPPQSA